MAQNQYNYVQSSKPRHIKSHNQKLVLSLLRNTKLFSISEVAENTNLSKTTVKKIFERFMEMKLICPAGKGSSTVEGGKKPDLFAFNRTNKHIIVINIEKLALINLCSEIEDIIYMDADCMSYSYEKTITSMADNIRILIDKHGITQGDLAGIAVGMAGIIDSANGVICNAVHHPTWNHNLEFRKDLAATLQFDVPIYLENGISFLGYAELLELEQNIFDTLVTIYSDSHTGGCVFKNSELIQGNNGFMGEFGHMIADPHSDIRCICGAHGCFEVMVSPERLLESAMNQFKEHPNSLLFAPTKNKSLQISDIFSASNSNDLFACKLIDEIIFWFAILVRNIILCHDPQIIVLRGTYQSAGNYFLSKLRERVGSSSIFQSKKDISIIYSNMDSHEALFVGAGYFVWNNFLNDIYSEYPND